MKLPDDCSPETVEEEEKNIFLSNKGYLNFGTLGDFKSLSTKIGYMNVSFGFPRA